MAYGGTLDLSALGPGEYGILFTSYENDGGSPDSGHSKFNLMSVTASVAVNGASGSVNPSEILVGAEVAPVKDATISWRIVNTVTSVVELTGTAGPITEEMLKALPDGDYLIESTATATTKSSIYLCNRRKAAGAGLRY